MMNCAISIFSICFVFPFTLGVDCIFTSLIVTPFVGWVAFQRLHRPFHTLILFNFIFIEVINRPRKYVMKIVVLRLAFTFILASLQASISACEVKYFMVFLNFSRRVLIQHLTYHLRIQNWYRWQEKYQTRGHDVTVFPGYHTY